MMSSGSTIVLVLVCQFCKFEFQVRKRSGKKTQEKKWNSHPWGEFGSGFHSVRSKMGPYKASIEASTVGEDNDGLDNLDIDDSMSTSTGTISTVS